MTTCGCDEKLIRANAEREVKKLVLANGTAPFDEWFEALDDTVLQAAVAARLARVRAGNFGDHKFVGAGVFELRIQKGPGLRVYYGLRGETLVVLIGGGDKSTQASDILRARKLWKEFCDATQRLQNRSGKKAP